MSLPLANIPFLNKRIKFPVTPHIPGGITSPEQLRRIADVSEKYGGKVKIVGSSITITGLNLVDGEKALAELGCAPESFISKTVRAVTMCPGKGECPKGQQDATGLGLALDEEFFGQQVPSKLRIAVSGCPNCCMEPHVKDIGLFGLPKGYTIVVGGNGGRLAKIAQTAAENVPADEVAPIIRAIIAWYREHGREKERLGSTIDRIGWEDFVQNTIPTDYRPPK